ncbi:MAG: tetratricopeptide repeat protein [Deltaproteobacteria bacterium]|nr:tetratricopeptide repeat protein [Deltaproteobacteria bacterium]
MKKIAGIFLLLIFLFPCAALGESAAVRDEVKEAGILEKKAVKIFKKTGNLEDALVPAEKALEIRERVLGKEHPAVASSLDIMASFYFSARNYKEAESLYREALGIREKTLGEDDPSVALSLNSLGRVSRVTGRYGEAEAHYRRALAILEKKYGAQHVYPAYILYNLAFLYECTGKYKDAEALFKKVLDIREKALGKEHPDVVAALNSLAALYRGMGRYNDAESTYKRVLEIREKKLGVRSPDTASNLYNLASVYDDAGRYAEAEDLYERVLGKRRAAFGQQAPQVVAAMNDLALVQYRRGHYAAAEKTLRQVIAIYEKQSAIEDLNKAETDDTLGLLYSATGRYTGAEALYKKALETREKRLGVNHLSVASTVGNIAALYQKTGREKEAEPLYLRAINIYLNALDRKYRNPARLVKFLMADLNNYALLICKAGGYAEIKEYHKSFLDLSVKILGSDHPQVAAGLASMAEIYRMTGDFAQAAALYERTLAIRERVLGKEHPEVASTMLGLAGLYAALRKHRESHVLFKRGMSVNEAIKEESFLLLSERQKLGYMKQRERDIYRFISHTAVYMRLDAGAVTDAFNTWIKWKGAVMETQGRYLDAVLYADILYYKGGKHIRKKFDELTNVRREIAKLQFSKPAGMSGDELGRKLEFLEDRKESLERALNVEGSKFTLETIIDEADVKGISEILPEDSLYLDFARIRKYDFEKDGWGGFRYVLFVFVPGKAPAVKIVDLAGADKVDDHVSAYLREMGKAKTGQQLPDIRILNREAKALYELVWKPAEPYLEGKRIVHISPDGNLNLIPFGVLVTPQSRYLIGEYLINYVATGRDIIRFTDVTTAEGTSIIMADPDYDMGSKELAKAAERIGFSGTRMGGRVSRDAAGMRFGRLPDTKREADVIEDIVRDRLKIDVKNYQDGEAVEDVLYQAEHPRILHLATHGYFLNEEDVAEGSMVRGVSIKMKEGPEGEGFMKMENPMLRSGIVLAGVNTSLEKGSDVGMVSAEKIRGLKLRGTDLVVLSACETGVGDVRSGEGVFGLKRAFITSGAETVVMSLWSVPSRETTELMTDFYTLMAEGKSKAEALRQAKLKMAAKMGHPFFWGAFVMVGDPG